MTKVTSVRRRLIKWPGQKLGASNDAIYKGLLGMSDSEIAELKEKKVI
ncbi:MAG: hypothetical protein II876_11755 [Synergistaceae bacterium]|nr:hypothetical protein [Synergistaceae bacterium]